MRILAIPVRPSELQNARQTPHTRPSFVSCSYFDCAWGFRNYYCPIGGYRVNLASKEQTMADESKKSEHCRDGEIKTCFSRGLEA